MSSYVLDRDLLLTSARVVTNTCANNWIDANSNTALLGTTVYQRNTDADIRKQMADVIINKIIIGLSHMTSTSSILILEPLKSNIVSDKLNKITHKAKNIYLISKSWVFEVGYYNLN